MSRRHVNYSQARTKALGLFDAGIGGIPLAAWIRRQRPDVPLVYLGDAARRPYGPRPGEEIARFVAEAEAFFVQRDCAAWVIACNTASVVADAALSGALPVVTMVDAVRKAVPEPSEGPVALLATAGTVASGVFLDALPEHDVRQVATEELLRLGETDSSDVALIERLSTDALNEVAAYGCRHAVLACTDFTVLRTAMERVSPGVALIDPLEAAGALALELLDTLSAGEATTSSRPLDRVFLTGPHPVDVRRYATDRFALDLPQPEIVALPDASVPIR